MSEPCAPASLSQDQLYTINQQNIHMQQDAYKAQQEQFYQSSGYAHQEAVMAKLQTPVEILGSLGIIAATCFVLISRAIRAYTETETRAQAAQVEIAKSSPITPAAMAAMIASLERVANQLERLEEAE